MQFQYGGHWANILGFTSGDKYAERILQNGEKIVRISGKSGGAIDHITITLNTGTLKTKS